MSHAEQTRLAVLDLYSRTREPVTAIAARFGISVSTLYRWRQLQARTRSLAPKPPSTGRPPKIGTGTEASLRQLVTSHPGLTLAVYTRLLAETTGVKVSEVTLARCLRRLGLRPPTGEAHFGPPKTGIAPTIYEGSS